MRRGAIVLVSGLFAVTANAAVYKCTGASGALEFRDRPCAADQSGGEIQVAGVAPAQKPAATAGEATSADSGGDTQADNEASDSTLDSTLLSGRWCEYAVSASRDGEKDRSAPANWSFDSATVEYAAKGASGRLKAGLKRAGADLSIDHPVLGGLEKSWTLVTFNANEAVLHGPYGGYFHLHRSSCP